MPSNAAKVAKFRQTLPPEESELIICSPLCTIDHDSIYPDWMRPDLPEAPAPTAHCTIHVEGAVTPTAKSLMKHAYLYGKDEVAEVAAMYGVVLPPRFQTIPDRITGKKPKKKGVPRKQQAIELLEQGFSWTVIEDTLNLPLSVSKRLRDEIGA